MAQIFLIHLGFTARKTWDSHAKDWKYSKSDLLLLRRSVKLNWVWCFIHVSCITATGKEKYLLVRWFQFICVGSCWEYNIEFPIANKHTVHPQPPRHDDMGGPETKYLLRILTLVCSENQVTLSSFSQFETKLWLAFNVTQKHRAKVRNETTRQWI